MERLTYKEAYDKIIDAYFKDEIKPLESDFCFCGTLSPTKGGWNLITTFSFGNYTKYSGIAYDYFQPYTLVEYKKMEWALIHTKNSFSFDVSYEDCLFAGMEAALEVLKQIHRERGENVDEVQTKFVKRELATK